MLRVVSGLVGILMLLGMIVSLLQGDSFIHGPNALTMLLMPFAFLLYAFGGQTLMRRFLPMFDEGKEQKKKTKLKPANGQDK